MNAGFAGEMSEEGRAALAGLPIGAGVDGRGWQSTLRERRVGPVGGVLEAWVGCREQTGG